MDEIKTPDSMPVEETPKAKKKRTAKKPATEKVDVEIATEKETEISSVPTVEEKAEDITPVEKTPALEEKSKAKAKRATKKVSNPPVSEESTPVEETPVEIPAEPQEVLEQIVEETQEEETAVEETSLVDETDTVDNAERIEDDDDYIVESTDEAQETEQEEQEEQESQEDQEEEISPKTAFKKPFAKIIQPKPRKTPEEIAEERKKRAQELAEERKLLASLSFRDKIKFLFSKDKKKMIKKEPVRIFADVDQGLTSTQVDARILEGFYNKSGKKYSKTYKSIFIGNIFTFFNLLCVLVAIVLLLARTFDPLQYSFMLILACNVTFGIVQEIRAKRKIDKLTILSSPSTRAIRNGETVEIPVENVVMDDILLLTAGQQVPADCTCLDGQAELNEALLTGESTAIKKTCGDTLYAGSFLSSGKCAVRVDKVSEDTYISKLTARAKTYKRPKSEIMSSIGLFIKVIGLIILPVALLMFFTNYAGNPTNWWDSIKEMHAQGGILKLLFTGNAELGEAIRYTCGVIIGMIPSGLLLLTTITLSVGMIRLARYNTLVQDMYSLETLARVNVLCLDKTGTITDGRMQVSDCILLNNPTEYSVDDIVGSLLAALDDNNQTSIALYERFGHSQALQPTHRLPFSSQRKLSGATFGNVGTFIIGAPEFVLRPMPSRISKIVKQYAQMGLRVMVLAHSPTAISGDKAPSSLRAIAILTLTDNIRTEAIDTIKWFKENEVEVKVISGDNAITVSEVARRAGIKNASRFISLEGLSDIEVENAAKEYTVFGRVSPEQKAILIRSMKQAGNTVAMTGDGVNDILAMKEADCAISVASGSEAARNVSNLVLQDNNFASMPKIVNEGRRVINNVKNSASLYIMKTLLIFILAVFCISTGNDYFFTPKNMALYEMLISAIPSFVLSLQPNSDRVKGKFIPYVISRALPGAITMAISLIAVFIINLTGLRTAFGFDKEGIYEATMILTLTFTGLVMLYRVCQPFNVVRAVLFTFVAIACVGALLLLHIPINGIAKWNDLIITGWPNITLELQQYLLLIILVQAAMPLSSVLIRFFDMFNPAED